MCFLDRIGSVWQLLSLLFCGFIQTPNNQILKRPFWRACLKQAIFLSLNFVEAFENVPFLLLCIIEIDCKLCYLVKWLNDLDFFQVFSTCSFNKTKVQQPNFLMWKIGTYYFSSDVSWTLYITGYRNAHRQWWQFRALPVASRSNDFCSRNVRVRRQNGGDHLFLKVIPRNLGNWLSVLPVVTTSILDAAYSQV